MEKEQMPGQENALDARWFNRYAECNFEDYEKLNGEKAKREAQKELFLNDVVNNPDLDYPDLETFDIDEREERLLTLKEDVLELEQNETVKKIYRTKINELVATLRMLRATKNKDDRKFSKYADFIYGKPSEEDSVYVFNSIKEKLPKYLNSDDFLFRDAAERLNLFLSNVESDRVSDGGATKDILPTGQDIEGNIEGVDEAVKIFEEALVEYGIDDWTIVVDSKKGISSFSVSQEHKVIDVPSDEKIKARQLSKKKALGLVEHEVGTHIVRRHKGERSKLKLLGLGLDRYLKGEEGVSTYAEQQVMGAKEFAGVPRYFSVAVAKGVDGKPRDFRETFEIMKDYRLLTQAKSDNPEQKAAETAYNDCVRIFRGSTGTTPGAIYPKDMAYFGNRAIWTLVSKNSDAVLNFSVGKYDPTNSEHVAVLTELGILDADLENLETGSI